jgi:hypothetical protein
MTIERDDPERGDSSAEESLAQALSDLVPGGDHGLVAWALNAFASSLLKRGVTPSQVPRLVREAFRDFARVRHTVRDPKACLEELIELKADRHLELRGIEPRPAPQARAPLVLDLVRIKEAMATLTPEARKALQLIYGEKRTLEEVAAALGMTVADVELAGGTAVDQLWVWWRSHRRGL